MLRLPIPVLHSITFRPQQPSVFHAIWPAFCHFNKVIYSAMPGILFILRFSSFRSIACWATLSLFIRFEVKQHFLDPDVITVTHIFVIRNGELQTKRYCSVSQTLQYIFLQYSFLLPPSWIRRLSLSKLDLYNWTARPMHTYALITLKAVFRTKTAVDKPHGHSTWPSSCTYLFWGKETRLRPSSIVVNSSAHIADTILSANQRWLKLKGIFGAAVNIFGDMTNTFSKEST